MQWNQGTIRRLEQAVLEDGGGGDGTGLASIPALLGNATVDLAVEVTTAGSVRSASIPAIVGNAAVDLSVTVT